MTFPRIKSLFKLVKIGRKYLYSMHPMSLIIRSEWADNMQRYRFKPIQTLIKFQFSTPLNLYLSILTNNIKLKIKLKISWIKKMKNFMKIKNNNNIIQESHKANSLFYITKPAVISQAQLRNLTPYSSLNSSWTLMKGWEEDKMSWKNYNKKDNMKKEGR